LLDALSSIPAGPGRTGCQLESLVSNSLVSNKIDNAAIPVADPATAAAAPEKHGWLPLLTVLFLISYGLMTMLIVEQGQTIESQRVLIRELFRDSTELSAVKQAQMANSQISNTKNAAASQTRAQSPSAKAPMTQIPSTQIPSTQTQTPSTQAPTKQIPSSQAVPQHQAQKQNQKPQFRMPTRPASDLMDENRSLITI
jgi:hypothetical protein